MFGKHLLDTCVAQQSVTGTSSGECEFYAIGSGGARTIFTVHIMDEMGHKVIGRVFSDSSAGRAMRQRMRMPAVTATTVTQNAKARILPAW